MEEDRTEVFELTTEEEVAEFCRLLQESKEVAPRSLRYTVALTARRTARVRAPYDEASEKRSPLENGFARLVSG